MWAMRSRRTLRPSARGDVELGQGAGAGHGGDGAHGLLAAAHVATPAGGFHLAAAQLARDVGGADAKGGHAFGVEFDAHFAGQATHALDRTDAFHGEQTLGDGVVHHPAEGFLVEAVGTQRPCAEGPAGGGDLGDHRLAHVGGQVGAHPADGGTHFGLGLVGVLLQLEFDGDGHLAIEDGGVHLLDAGQRGDAVFELARDFGFQRARGGAGQAGADGDHRQFNVREVLHAGALEGQQAGQGEQGEEQDRRDGVADGEGGEVHGRGLTWRPGRCPLRPP